RLGLFLTHADPEATAALRADIARWGDKAPRIFEPKLDQVYTIERNRIRAVKLPPTAKRLDRYAEAAAVAGHDWHNDYARLMLLIQQELRKAESDAERRRLLKKMHRLIGQRSQSSDRSAFATRAATDIALLPWGTVSGDTTRVIGARSRSKAPSAKIACTTAQTGLRKPAATRRAAASAAVCPVDTMSSISTGWRSRNSPTSGNAISTSRSPLRDLDRTKKGAPQRSATSATHCRLSSSGP